MANASLRSLMGPLGWFLLLPSMLAALGGAWLIVSGAQLGGDTRSAQGRVVAHQTAQLRRSIGQHSVVEFAVPDGSTVRVVDALVRQGGAVHTIGESVTVGYPAADPSQAQISSTSWVTTFLGAIMLFVSCIGMALGGLLLRLRPKVVPIATVG